jgi:hypothetical protein
MLLLLSTMHTFHEHWPRGIYTIGEIVSHVMLTTINSEGHFMSVSSYDINEQWRLIQHIDVIVGTGDFKDNCRVFDVPLCKLSLPTY